MNSCELVTFVSSLACVLSEKCTSEELSIMAAVFTQLGDTLVTIVTHNEICCDKNKDSSSKS